jgi:septal ring factor EnvC (AmiA/AmiB activator)
VPRKKTDPAATAAAVTAGGIITMIFCPACKSSIGSDGKTLHEKSAYLDELVETDRSVDEVEKKIEKMQKTVAAHEATIADLRTQLEAAAKKPTPQERESPSVVRQEKAIGNGRAKPKSPSWWD